MNSPVGDPPEFIELNNAEFYSAMAEQDGDWVSTKPMKRIFTDQDFSGFGLSDKIEKASLRPWWKSKKRVV